MQQLNALDSAFLYLDTLEAPMAGGFLQIYAPARREDDQVRFDSIRRHIEHSVDKSPIFHRVIVRSPFDIDHAWFSDGAHIDFDYHVRHHALPKPGNDAQLNAMYARLCGLPMDLSRPMWEIHVIDGLNAVDGAPEGSFALVTKFHHAGVDGGAAAELMAALHRTDKRRTRGKKAVSLSVRAPAKPTLLGAMSGNVKRYGRFTSGLWGEVIPRLPGLGGKAIRKVISQFVRSRNPDDQKIRVPDTIFNRVEVGAFRSYTHLSLSLDTIRKIRERVPGGATVNDVYLAAASGCLKRYLEEKDELPEDSLVGICTVNVRTEDAMGKGGNQAAAIRIPLHTDLDDPARRLTLIAESSSKAKGNIQGEAAKKFARWLPIVPAPLIVALTGIANRLRITAKMPPLFNMTITNVPGPAETLYLDGARLIDFSGAPMLFHGSGIAINATSYDGQLQVAINACRRIVSEEDSGRMRRYMLEAFAELQEVYGV